MLKATTLKGWTIEDIELLDTLASERTTAHMASGETEEGDPWYAILTPKGDTLFHAAIVDGQYVGGGLCLVPSVANTLSDLLISLGLRDEEGDDRNVPFPQARKSVLVRGYHSQWGAAALLDKA